MLDERAPGPWPDRDEALALLAARYYATRGPATERDLAGWASLTLAEARRATAAAAPGLASSADDEGLTWWHAPGEPPAPDPAGRVDLVQGPDELAMSYSRTRHVFAAGVAWPPARADAVPGHAVLVDGRLAGRWGYARDSRGEPARLVVRARPGLRPELGTAVAAFGRFVGRDLDAEVHLA